MDFTLAGTVILSGLVIVFIALILLTAIVSVVGRLMGKTVPTKPAAQLVPPPTPARPQTPTQPQKATPTGADDLPDELVAVITAAVAVAMDGSNYVIRSVREAPAPRRNARSAWCLAGMVHNTRPL